MKYLQVRFISTAASSHVEFDELNQYFVLPPLDLCMCSEDVRESVSEDGDLGSSFRQPKRKRGGRGIQANREIKK